MVGVFSSDDVMVEEIVSEHRPESVSLVHVELVEEVRVQFLRSPEEIFEVVRPVILIETHVPVAGSFDVESDHGKIPNIGFHHVRFRSPVPYEYAVGPIRITQDEVFQIVVRIGEFGREEPSIQ